MEGLRISERQLIAAAVDGLAGAAERYEEASGLRGTYVPLAEALSWCGVLDEHLRSRPWYEQERMTEEGGRLQPGLRYARNFATHQLVALTESGDDYVSFPLWSGDDGSLYKTAFRWLSADDLPAPAKGSKFTPLHRQCFQDLLAGHDVGGTLAQSVSWFQRARKIALNLAV